MVPIHPKVFASCLVALFAAGLAFVSPASAQTVRVRGWLTTVEDRQVGVRLHDGTSLMVQLGTDAVVGRRVRADVSAVHPQDYVGVAALPEKGGDLRALEVVIFPPEQRGAGEGHKPLDLLPESTMTNATIADAVDSTDGKKLRLTYKGGEKSVLLTPETRFFTLAPGMRTDLQPGRQVSMSVQQSGGQFGAARITVDVP